MKTRLVIPENRIIGIREFMNNYLNVNYQSPSRLTHYEMDKYLLEKGYKLPMRIKFGDINMAAINEGKYIAVREETKKKKKGRILFYENPYSIDIDILSKTLSKELSKNLEKVRKEILEKYCDMTLDEMGEVISISEFEQIKEEELYQVTEAINRQNAFAKRGKRLVKKERY